MNKLLSERIEEIIRLCQRYKVKSLYTFGSVGSDAFNNQSDIDFLIDFDADLSINEYALIPWAINDYNKLQYETSKETELGRRS